MKTSYATRAHVWLPGKSRRVILGVPSAAPVGKASSSSSTVALALLEAMHKRLSYLRGDAIVRLSDYVRRRGLSAPAVTNAARRQTVPAFREKGVWKIGDRDNLSAPVAAPKRHTARS